MPRLKANITPEVIKWARKSCHYSLEEAAQKIGRSLTEIEAWESGESKPSMAQARRASEVYKRPLAVFFLPHTPKDFSTLRDFRRLPTGDPREYSPNLVFLIRLTQERQIWLSDYLRDEGFPPVEFIGSASVSVDRVRLASQIRNTLGVNQDEIRRCRSRGDALRLWVEAAEDLGVFVFQSGNMQYEKIAVKLTMRLRLAASFLRSLILVARTICSICISELSGRKGGSDFHVSPRISTFMDQ